MTKEKMIGLKKYISDLTDRLNGAIPKKHEGHPETFKAFLKKEIKDTKAKIDAALLEGAGK